MILWIFSCKIINFDCWYSYYYINISNLSHWMITNDILYYSLKYMNVLFADKHCDQRYVYKYCIRCFNCIHNVLFCIFGKSNIIFNMNKKTSSYFHIIYLFSQFAVENITINKKWLQSMKISKVHNPSSAWTIKPHFDFSFAIFTY